MQLSLPDTIALMAKNGDAWAINELVHMHDRMLKKNAYAAAKSAFSMDVSDLFNEAVCAMLSMLRSWSPTGGSSFFTYAYGFMGQHLRRAKDDRDMIVSIPAHRAVKDRKSNAGALPLTTSLYKPGFEDECMLDEVEATAAQPDPDRANLEAHLQTLIDRLPPREADVIRATHYLDIDQTELAAKYGVTRQAISQSYRNGMEKLKRMAARSL